MTDPARLPDMPAVRAAIDALDAEIVALLARRMALIDRAAAIKTREDLPARIEWRVEQVVQNARHHAGMSGLDPDLAETVWRALIEHAIAREETLMKGHR